LSPLDSAQDLRESTRAICIALLCSGPKDLRDGYFNVLLDCIQAEAERDTIHDVTQGLCAALSRSRSAGWETAMLDKIVKCPSLTQATRIRMLIGFLQGWLHTHELPLRAAAVPRPIIDAANHLNRHDLFEVGRVLFSWTRNLYLVSLAAGGRDHHDLVREHTDALCEEGRDPYKMHSILRGMNSAMRVSADPQARSVISEAIKSLDLRIATLEAARPKAAARTGGCPQPAAAAARAPSPAPGLEFLQTGDADAAYAFVSRELGAGGRPGVAMKFLADSGRVAIAHAIAHDQWEVASAIVCAIVELSQPDEWDVRLGALRCPALSSPSDFNGMIRRAEELAGRPILRVDRWMDRWTESMRGTSRPWRARDRSLRSHAWRHPSRPSTTPAHATNAHGETTRRSVRQTWMSSFRAAWSPRHRGVGRRGRRLGPPGVGHAPSGSARNAVHTGRQTARRSSPATVIRTSTFFRTR
jgi:hypothetical protein